eukprot:10338534-Heterocapsa_arctica.AAC.1
MGRADAEKSWLGDQEHRGSKCRVAGPGSVVPYMIFSVNKTEEVYERTTYVMWRPPGKHSSEQSGAPI